MPDKDSRLRVTGEGGATVVELTDRKILDEVGIRQIGEELNALATAVRNPKLILDFANVAHMSSSALGMLITLHKRIRERDGRLCLCNVRPTILEIFVITKLNSIFQIAESREAALGLMS